MRVAASIGFDGWCAVYLELPDDFDAETDSVPDDAVQVALRGSWEDFGVYAVQEVLLHE
jgi:hypothetical protein